MTYIKLKCDRCKTTFNRPLREYNCHKKRKLKREYCGHNCAVGFDERLSVFKRAFCQSRANSKPNKARPNQGKEFNISVEYIADLWDKQKGRCALTKVEMKPPLTHDTQKRGRVKLWQASLDRIDGGKGYIKGNVQWVISFANWGKNKSTDADAKRVIKMIREA